LEEGTAGVNGKSKFVKAALSKRPAAGEATDGKLRKQKKVKRMRERDKSSA